MFEAQLPIIELQYQDNTGRKAAFQMHCRPDTTYSSADASATALASVVASITGATLVRQRIIFKAVATPKETAAEGSSVKRQGVFFFEGVDELFQGLIGVPAFDEDKYRQDEPGAGVLVNLEDSYVIAFIEAYLSLEWTNRFGVVMHRLITAYRQSRV